MTFILNMIIEIENILELIMFNIYAVLNNIDTIWDSPIELMKDIYKTESEFYRFLKAKLNIVKNRLSQSA